MLEQLVARESELLLLIQDHLRNPVLTPIMKAITSLGNGGIFWIILTLAMLAWPKTRRIGLCSGCALIGSALVNNLLLKNLIARTRPYEVIPALQLLVGKAWDYSFPSGHSAASFASAVAVFRTAPKRYGVPLLILAALIAFSRLYVGIHYPTDVVFGSLSGILLGILAVPAADGMRAGLAGRRERRGAEA